jgi:signal transduction histidine kinase/CheY-like chemotaxis protein
VFVEPPFHNTARQAFQTAVDQRQPLPFDSPCPSPTGGERWIAWRYTAARDAGGRPRYVIGAGLDVTDQRRLAEQLRHAQKMETLGTLVGGIAHDFNNQLTVILGNLSLTLADLDHRSESYHQLHDAEQAAQRCADMTQGLLTFSRRRMGPLHVVDMNQFVNEAVRLLQRVLPSNVHLELRLDPSAGSVQGDATQLHQVLMNLALNARDAMPQGGTLTVATDRQLLDESAGLRNVEARPGAFAVLSVRDEGTGMTPEVKSRMFEPFFTTKDVGKGTGLGLSMVFGIVKAHRGWISVTSSPGKGSTFDVYLPAATESAEQRPAVPAPSEARGRECVLVVDDEDLVRSLARAVLERWGYRVLTARDGEEAIAIYIEQGAEVDLVLLDYAMPGLNGLEVLQRLQQIDPDVRVLFSSGHTTQADIDRLQEAGARGFVPKPYRPDEIMQRIRQALDEDRGPKREQ